MDHAKPLPDHLTLRSLCLNPKAQVRMERAVGIGIFKTSKTDAQRTTSLPLDSVRLLKTPKP